MTFSGVAARKALAFPELYQALCRLPEDVRRRALKTAAETGYLTDGSYLSRLSYKEKAEIDRRHWDALTVDPTYPAAAPFDIVKSLPPRLGPLIVAAREAGGDDDYRVVQLEGGGLQVLMESGLYHTLAARHPGSVWHFAHAAAYWNLPVVLLKGQGFFAGELLAAAAPVPVAIDYPPQTTPPLRRRDAGGKKITYRPSGSAR